MTYSTPAGSALHRFVAQLPHKPRATDDFQRGLYRHTPTEALECRYIQPDPEFRVSWLKFDGDHPDSGAAWIDQNLPRPHIFIGNRQTGRGHMLYGLKVPVAVSLQSRTAPIKWLGEVEAGFTRLLGTDPAFSGLTVKNPLHPDWYTHIHDGPLLSLEELSEALPRPVSRRKIPRQELTGLSRHLDLFDHLRFWAYGEALSAKRGGNAEAWTQAVTLMAHSMNLFEYPLDQSSVRSISRSVARWTWRNAEKLSGSKIGGVKRSKVKSWQRETFSPEDAKRRMADGAGYTHAIQRSATFDAITSAIGGFAAEGIQHPTGQQIADRAGVSLRTVRRFSSTKQGHN